uniref:Xanthine dehydrogenase/oxidase-like n=1 Tax=Phallusia mammillata TaxID=59560 RepID=A0A6F9DWG0_9ASCI|nr:xanthine dehydrogenase/oxidase-like [Phallusia mammillata]
MGLFYKFYLSLCDKSQLGPGIESAIPTLTRPVSSGTQTFDSDPEIFPVSKAIPKLASKYQASGEAVYISDKIPSPEELYCTFVLSNIANADIDCIDFTEASKMNGFVQIITGKDFPSDVNNTYLYPNDITQPLLAVDHVEFAGQPLAIVVAETNSQAKAIAQAVKVTYKNEKTPLLTVKDAIQANSFFSIDNPVTETGNVEEALNKTKNMVSGELHLGYQYHFYMETQIARAEPTEEGGFKLDIATQMQKDVQDAIAFAFNTSSNK